MNRCENEALSLEILLALSGRRLSRADNLDLAIGFIAASKNEQ